MKRRSLLLTASAATLGATLVVPHALGQAAKEPRPVGLLTVSTEASFANSLQAFRDGLRERGHGEGRDIVIDTRYADGRAQELPRLAAELAALKPAVIIAPGQPATDAALAAAAEVPIVSLGDLVAAGHAAQLARPGGRVTGVSFLRTPLNAKRLELLAELLPKGSAVLNLADPLARDRDMQVGRRRWAFARAGDARGVRAHARRDRDGVHCCTQAAGGRGQRALARRSCTPTARASSNSRPAPSCPPSTSGRRTPATAD